MIVPSVLGSRRGMGLFDRRKDASASTPEESVAEEPVATKKVAAAPAELAAEPAAEEPAAAKKVAAAPPAPPKPSAAKPPAEPETLSPAIHTVATGESLADLASRYGVPAEEIARQNHVPPPGQIHAGQVFVIRS